MATTSGTADKNCVNQNIDYTEVVVIGNGPSGICLSYMLSGYWPYYTGEPHSDEFLNLRLQNEGTESSLIEQDLEYLASGLEGRSSNPVSLLFDTLTHPNADMGSEDPSLLEWKKDTEKSIPHVVLGKKAEGGAWQMMEGQMQTLSLGTWMQLPDMPFKQWLQKHRKENCRNLKVHSNRASMDDVKHYYGDFVKSKELGSYFRNHSTVTSVSRVLDVCHSIDDESGEQVPCSRDHSGKLKWEVRGFTTTDSDDTVEFCYRSPYVVVATGTFDMPNRLTVPGEQFPYIVHSFREMEKLIESGELNPHSDPLVVIGAGLSSADAILCALEKNIPVVHVFRRDVEDPNIVLSKLPSALYPEYHHVHRLMMGRDEVDGYQAYPVHAIKEFLEDKQILLSNPSASCDIIVKTACVVVSIGSRADLSFLPKDGKSLGVVPGMAIDSKHNPVDVDPITYQSMHECGLYAMGPLVGDNFVRFLRGGALGITSHLWKKREGKL